jgi:predicted RNA-binding protein with EMAP domain
MTTNRAILDPINDLLNPEELTSEKIKEVIYFLKDQYTDLLKDKEEELKLKDELIEQYHQEVVYLREMVTQLSQRPSIGELVETAQEYRDLLKKYSELNPV